MDMDYEGRDAGRQVKTTVLLGVVAFAIALAVVLGNKMSEPVASVLTGVIAGVAASIPTSFVLVALLRARANRDTTMPIVESPMAAPVGYRIPRAQPIMQSQRGNGIQVPHGQSPVIVVTPGGAYGTPYGSNAVYPEPMPVLTPVQREFQVIG
jgi:hypothetical protein